MKTQEIIEILQSKNRCLERLLEATRSFLAAPVETLITENAHAPTPLTVYEEARSSLIRMLELQDREIADGISKLTLKEKTESFLAAVRSELQQHERLIVSVFNADEVVFAKIRQAQSQISRLVQENRKNRDVLARFKSAQGQTGEGMDKTL